MKLHHLSNNRKPFNRVPDGFSMPLEQKCAYSRSLHDSCLPADDSYADRLLNGHVGVATNFSGACS